MAEESGGMDAPTHIAFIAVGSNLGDKAENCRAGIRELDAEAEVRVLDQSRFYRTAPVDYTDQDWFVNAVVRIETALSPETLLARLKAIEKKQGRTVHPIRFGPRVLDMDIVLYDDRVIRTEILEIPHPRMHKRRFVLIPICDIDPLVVHPVLGQTVSALAAALGDPNQEIAPL